MQRKLQGFIVKTPQGRLIAVQALSKTDAARMVGISAYGAHTRKICRITPLHKTEGYQRKPYEERQKDGKQVG